MSPLMKSPANLRLVNSSPQTRLRIHVLLAMRKMISKDRYGDGYDVKCFIIIIIIIIIIVISTNYYY